jgi:N-acetylmuramoyl-L-alanine amidase
MRPINKIIVHCSDTDGGDAAAIKRFHTAPPPQGRGWSDIGYHFVIDYDGTVEPGRPEAEEGAHCQGHNIDSIGICLIGVNKSDVGMFKPAQYSALRKLVQSLLSKYGLTADKVFGHYEFDTAIAQGKTCPNLDADWLRKFVAQSSEGEDYETV